MFKLYQADLLESVEAVEVVEEVETAKAVMVIEGNKSTEVEVIHQIIKIQLVIAVRRKDILLVIAWN